MIDLTNFKIAPYDIFWLKWTVDESKSANLYVTVRLSGDGLIYSRLDS